MKENFNNENISLNKEVYYNNEGNSPKNELGDIIKYFYSSFLPQVEAGYVSINSDETIFLKFNYIIAENNIKFFHKKKDTYKNEIIPTLLIKNKNEFDSVLREYITLAYEFFNSNKKNSKYSEQFILGLTFTDLTVEDFNDPVAYLRRLINFIKDNTFEEFARKDESGTLIDKEIGVSEILGGEIYANEAISTPRLETPKEFRICVYGEDYSIYSLPIIRYGISNNTAYIYSIQNKKSFDMLSEFDKKVGRKMYKVNTGFDTKEDTYENYGVGNLSDISPSFLLVASIFLGLLKNKGIDNIVVTPFTPVRWNNKIEAAESYRESVGKKSTEESNSNIAYKNINDKLNDIDNTYRNINDKLIRTFLRLSSQMVNVEVLSYPFELDSSLHIRNSGELECDNPLLKELYELGLNFEEGGTL